MLLTKSLEIKLTKFNINYYRRIGYDLKNEQETFILNIEDIGKDSNLEINVKCDFCGKETQIQYKNYIKNIHSNNLYACSNKCAVKKGEMTMIARYGAKYPLQVKEIYNKVEQTCMENYGVRNISMLKSNKEKVKETNLKNYGYITNLNIPEMRANTIKASHTVEADANRKKVMDEKYGGTGFGSEIISQRIKKSNRERYGADYPAQNIDVYNKTQKSGFLRKDYKEISYQGTYELHFLMFCEENDIFNKLSKVKSIKYQFDKKNKIYHPDFYIEEFNLIIEIKSNYYYKLYEQQNLCKQIGAIESGYNFIFIINKKYDEFLFKIKNN